jgi:regulatory protein
MPTITKIQPQRRKENRRSVHLDGTFAFGCNLNVIARFRLREGMNLTAEEVEQIQQGEVRQECFDAALRFVQMRLHSRTELKRKLARKEFGPATIEGVLDDLIRMEYLDDQKFATAKASSAARHKHHGPRRAMQELMRAGVSSTLARQTTAVVYADTDPLAIAMNLAERQVARLKRLDPPVAKRRLMGLLVRRGFDSQTVRTVVHRTLGHSKG